MVAKRVMPTSVIHVSYTVNMKPENVIHADRVPTVPKQTRPRMVPLSFRVPAETKDQGYAKADRLGVNPTEVMRQLWVAWAKEEDEAKP